MPPIQYEISAPALYAARTLLKNFVFSERPGAKVRATEKNLATLIDVCTQIFRVERVMDRMVHTVPWLDKRDLAQNLENLREAVRAVEVVRSGMPKFPRNEGIVLAKKHFEPDLTRSQVAEMERVRLAVVGAKTVEEQQRILQAAGIVRHR